MRRLLLPALALLCGFTLGAFLFQVHQGEAAGCLNGSIREVFSPGAEEQVVELIRGANETIDVQLYLFSYEPLAEELVEAGGRGVEVRVILEPRLSGNNPNLETMEVLREGGVDALWAPLEYKLTHTKAMIIDGKIVLVGSTNWSYSALKKNREYSVLIEDEGVAREFLREFEKDWGKATAQIAG